jgi:shikimate kinase
MDMEHTNQAGRPMIASTPIFLVGFMGCGKTTVGEALARMLNRSFIDLDRLIEARANETIADLIARDGEARFRELETSMLREVAGSASVVVSLGGGAFTREINRELIEGLGLSVWLDAPFELCWRRVEADPTVRPLAPDEATARKLYEARLAIYRSARFRVAVEEARDEDEIAGRIVTLLNERAV